MTLWSYGRWKVFRQPRWRLPEFSRLPARTVARSDGGLLRQRNTLDPVGVQYRQYVTGKAPDLLNEHRVRQHPAIEADLYSVGAGAVGGVDDPPRNLVPGTPRHVLGLALDIGHRQAAKILAGELRGAQILGADVIGRSGARIAGFALPLGLGEVAVAEQGTVEVEMVRAHLAHRPGLAVGDIGADAERQMV